MNVTSGYFYEVWIQGFLHEGHIDLIKRASKKRKLILLVDRPENFEKKYNIKNGTEVQKYIVEKLREWVTNENLNVWVFKQALQTYDTLRCFSEDYRLTFVKGGDRTKGSLPEEELNVLKTYHIKFEFLKGPKLDSASKIITEWKPTFWGFEKYTGTYTKLLHAIKPLSVQRHNIKEEMWTAMTDVYLTVEDKFIHLKPGEHITIPSRTLHCLLSGTVKEWCSTVDDTIRVFDWNRER